MMKHVLMAASVLAAAAAAPTLAQAQEPGPTGWYGALGYTHEDFEDADLGAVEGRLGYRLHPNFAVEGELAIGVTEESFGATDVRIDNQAAIYGVGLLPLGPNLDLFGRIGYGRTELSVDGPGGGFNGDDDSWNYGVGAAWFWDGANGVRGDYTRRDFDEGDDVDAWSIAYIRRF